MNLEQAKQLRNGQTVYHTVKKNADGTPMRAKVTSVKTWKRSTDRVEVGLKHGLYDYAKYDEHEIQYLTTEFKEVKL